MKIVLNHLTRMRGSRICVAGMDPTGRHVRPVTTSTSKLTRTLLTERGGPFEIGVILDLGEVQAAPSAPATEDHRFSVTNTRRIKRMSGEEYFHVLERVAHKDLESIFGPDLKRRKQTFAVDRGRGSTSLGVLAPKHKIELVNDRYGRLRLRLDDRRGAADLPVTDIRFVEEDHETIRRDVVEDVRWRLQSGVQAILMVGLTRLFQVSDDEQERHWLQVNGICLADRPLGPKP
ncbi:MAG TPA: hypothetical protein VGF15_06060 [Solirubrobacteraceae bacterium]|jgi:hypothetical protein